MSRLFRFLLAAFWSFQLVGCAPQRCTDALGCIEFPPGKAIEIGFFNPTTQLDQQTGADILSGINQALQPNQFIRGFPVELVKIDTTCLNADLPKVMAQVSDHNHLVTLIGPTCENNSETLSRLASDQGLIILSPAFRSISSYPGSFNISPSVAEQSTMIADNLTQQFPSARFHIRSSPSTETWRKELARLLQDKVSSTSVIEHFTDDVNDLPASTGSNHVTLLLLDKLSQDQKVLLNNLHPESQIVIFTPNHYLEPDQISQRKNLSWVGFPMPTRPAPGNPIATMSMDAIQLTMNAIRAVSQTTNDGRLLIPRLKLREFIKTQTFTGFLGIYQCSTQGSCSPIQFQWISSH